MKTEELKWISQRMRSLRLEKNLIRRHMAMRLKIARKTYAGYEEGRRTPSVFTLKRICTILETTLDEFFTGFPENFSFEVKQFSV